MSWGSRHPALGPAAAQGSSRAKRSSWSAQKGKTCHHLSHTRFPVGMGIPGLPQATHLGCPQPRGGCSSIPSCQGRGSRAALPTRSPTCPTCREPAGQGGPPARGRMLGDTLAWFPKGKARASSVASLPRRSRRLPACHDTLPTPGALCLPAIFGSLLRAPLRLLIMRVRNSFGLSYIRKGRGLEAAKYTGACGSERGAFGTACGKEIV